MQHEGKKPSKTARSAQYEEKAEADVETVVEGIVFKASARPHNWGSGGRPGAGAGGARSKPKEKILPVRLKMGGVATPIAKKGAARKYPSWSCTKCTYQHDQVKGEASLRKCVMCGASRRLHGAEEAPVSTAAPRPPPPPPRLSNASSAAHGHSFMCEGAAAPLKGRALNAWPHPHSRPAWRTLGGCESKAVRAAEASQSAEEVFSQLKPEANFCQGCRDHLLMPPQTYRSLTPLP